MTVNTSKQSYTIPCSSIFRDEVIKLAESRSVNVADIARSVLLVIPEDVITSFPDPGGPPQGDREETILKSGPSEGRPWRRKPRLQARLSPGYEVSVVRRALNLALILDDGRHSVCIQNLDTIKAEQDQNTKETLEANSRAFLKQSNQENEGLKKDIERLQSMISILLFKPLAGGVSTRADAFHILGYPPFERPDRSAVRSRFRLLATIHHPDSNYGNHQRMSQLNAAMEFLNA
jgi:hypothetical protein